MARAMPGRPYKRISEQVFKGVKLMLNGGASQKEAAECAGISQNTAYRIAKSNNYEEYIGYAYANGRNAYPADNAKEEVKQTHSVQITATHYMTEELREIKTLLKGISAKMAVIVEDLYGTKEG